jgi:energy-coupling factor transporter ATP-binding protein EcfA2
VSPSNLRLAVETGRLRIPSRRDNPFATCWTRPGAIPFHFTNGVSTEQLVAKLASHNWRGAIIGPHGSGKSTLIETLRPALASAGKQVAFVALRNRQRRLPQSLPATTALHHSNQVLIIDGYEQLGWLERLRTARYCRRNSSGLLVTAHSPTRLPTIIDLAPDQALVTKLVAELCSEVSTSLGEKDVAASHACHGSNVREIFFDLYDRHERFRRSDEPGSKVERTQTVHTDR